MNRNRTIARLEFGIAVIMLCIFATPLVAFVALFLSVVALLK